MENKKSDEFIIERIFDAPREMVWKAWTDPKYVSLWWGPKHFTAPFCEIDFKVGGKFTYCMQSPTGQRFWNNGFFQEITVPSQIVLTMYFCDEKGTRVEPTAMGLGPDFPSEMHDVITFEVFNGQQTKLTLKRNVPVDIAKKYQMDLGWSQSLERFATVVAEVERGTVK